jgi:hypothetical protein
MNCFNFVAEIRLRIYEEFIVLSELIKFETNWDLEWLSERYGLCPALLQAIKKLQRETSPLLNPGDRFGFSEVTYCSGVDFTDRLHVGKAPLKTPMDLQ